MVRISRYVNHHNCFTSGAGIFAASIRRTQLGVQGTLYSLVTPWTCMKELHNILFYIGEAAGAIMIMVVSLDRLLAVKWFAFYHNLGTRYVRMKKNISGQRKGNLVTLHDWVDTHTKDSPGMNEKKKVNYVRNRRKQIAEALSLPKA